MDRDRGLPGAADIGSIWLGIFNTADEAKAETHCVPWSLPSRGITGDLGGSLSVFILIIIQIPSNNLYTAR